ncbi:DUF4163 domain-containing protein [Sphingosinicella sp. LY1275]|uniref:DUF4163 domain-containing protein n=1 Tax=Sphingosinicella sp. LY1275 TaxID=3095379 RepID=UPI002ADEDD5B|nr:DUF4163 domain-containing protein [Sphingosinicella sp. LY1275]MEA1013763.1 DUF4163 domain-containing protein [Sphingosinicella sp. LY1275]
MTRTALAAALLLSACSAESDPAPTANTAAVPGSAAAAAPAEPKTEPAKPRKIEDKSDLLEFSYSWPAEAAAIAPLNARFEAQAAEARPEALATAKEDRDGRGPDFPFNGHFFHAEWQTMGDTPALLSLAGQIATFTGGAHGNSAYEAVLWDRAAGRPIAAADLFERSQTAFAAISPIYCAALDQQRSEKREEPLPLSGDGWMVECPALAEQVIAPVDANKDGRFELLRVLIAPYGAGPYAEGTYEVDVPVTPAIRKMVKKAYQAAF